MSTAGSRPLSPGDIQFTLSCMSRLHFMLVNISISSPAYFAIHCCFYSHPLVPVPLLWMNWTGVTQTIHVHCICLCQQQYLLPLFVLWSIQVTSHLTMLHQSFCSASCQILNIFLSFLVIVYFSCPCALLKISTSEFLLLAGISSPEFWAYMSLCMCRPYVSLNSMFIFFTTYSGEFFTAL